MRGRGGAKARTVTSSDKAASLILLQCASSDAKQLAAAVLRTDYASQHNLLLKPQSTQHHKQQILDDSCQRLLRAQNPAKAKSYASYASYASRV
jgi:hypothetical protein